MKHRMSDPHENISVTPKGRSDRNFKKRITG